MRSTNVLMLVATTGASLLMVSCGGASDAPLDARIVIENFSFGGDVSMPVGSTATVTNRDGVAHTWTADSGAFDSDVIGPGASFSFTFDQPGDIPSFCSIHDRSRLDHRLSITSFGGTS